VFCQAINNSMNNIPTIDFNSILVFLRSAEKTNWTIVRVKDDICNLEFMNKIKEVSKTVAFKSKDNLQLYEGIGIQYKDADITDDDKKYNILDVYSNNTFFAQEIGDFVSYNKEGKCFIVKSNLKRIKLSEVSQVLKDKAKQYDMKINNSNIHPSTSYVFLNEWAGVFKDFITYFLNKNIFLHRGRLLNCKPGKQSGPIHIDNNVRIHIPIYTNKKCTTTFYDKQKKLIGEYHLPADGSFYLFNSWLPHCFGNMGDEDRLHAVFAFTDKIFYYSKSKLLLANDIKNMMLKDLNKF